MAPRIGQKVTYADEYGKEFTAKIVEINQREDGCYLLNIEYRRDDRSNGKVNSVLLMECANTPNSHAKITCFTKQTPKETPKKPDTKKSG